MKVLLSAYACEPGKGSEPGTGWNLALALAGHCEITVLTRSNNRGAIESALQSLSGSKPEFIYHDLSPFFTGLKARGILSTQAYYALWQKSAGRAIPKVRELANYDVFHHVTFNSFEVRPGLLRRFPGARIWGPVGGGQRAPVGLTATLGTKSRIRESMRSLRVIVSAWNPCLRGALESCDLVLFANSETRNLFRNAKLGSSSEMIDVGVDPEQFAPTLKSGKGNRLFHASNFEPRKGTRLLLLAFRQALHEKRDLRLRLAGDGPERRTEEAWVRSNGLEYAVEFVGRRSHHQMSQEFADADLFVFPSIRDTSGAIVLEAMACGLPVICLDHQGARMMVDDAWGIRVKPRSLEATVSDLADAFVRLSGDGGLREAMGASARERVLENYSWEKKAEQLKSHYDACVAVRTRKNGR
ncbi:glycosyltransferase [Akkermansiaceae bacterium]|nr:glycosyltransferase [Akkermansiaceae bacterium]